MKNFKLDIGDLTYNVGFKFFFKDNSLRYYVASIVSCLLHKDYEYVIKNMHYLDVELVSSIKSLMRSDVIIEVADVVLIMEMNRNYIKHLNELKIRYANHIFNKMFYINPDNKVEFNGKKVILVLINAYHNGNIKDILGESRYKVKNEEGKELTEYLECQEFNLEKIKELWYSKVTISKQSKMILYLLMSRYSDEEIQEFIKGDEILMKAEKVRNELKNGKIYLDYDVEMENEFIKNEIREAALEEGQAVGQALGRAEGIKQEKENFIKNLYGILPISQIAKVANVSQEKVKQILML